MGRVVAVGAAGSAAPVTSVHLDDVAEPLRAVAAYAVEDLAWWSGQLGRELGPGSLGEDLTLEGVDVTDARVGDRWRVGAALLEVTVPRTDEDALATALGEDGFARAFRRAARPGAWLVVLEPGHVGPGDEVRVVRRREDHELSMGAVAVALHVDRRQREQLREQAGNLAPSAAAWVRTALAPVERRADHRRRRG